jgi:uncharacterized protein
MPDYESYSSKEASVKDQITILYKIQKIDAVIKSSEELKKRSAEEMQTAEASFLSAGAQHQTVQDHVASFEKQRRDRERDMSDAQGQKKKVEERLMSIKTNKEYQAALHEIDTIKALIKDKEDMILESMDAMEAAKAELKKSEAELGRAKGVFEEKKRQIEVELKAYLDDVDRQRRERDDLTRQMEQLAPDIFTNYQRLIKSKNGRAVAMVAYEQCMGCSMKIPAQIYNEVMLGEKIKFCPHCARILLMTPGEGDAVDQSCG